MKIYLAAAPHTLRRWKNGKALCDYVFGVSDDTLFSGGGCLGI